jgi:L-2-hydroxyglutarate oxidase
LDPLAADKGDFVLVAKRFDIAIIGGGIIGMATAMALAKKFGDSLVLLEAEERLAAHQSGKNSGVIHAGLYYRPGSLKARYCVSGRDALYHFLEDRGQPHERCGKVIVATGESELPLLAELEMRGRANGLEEIKRLKANEIGEYEPHARGIAGLLVPETGIVDFAGVTEAFARVVLESGGEIRRGAQVTSVTMEQGGMALETGNSVVHSRYLINCGGLYSDRIARMCGVEPGLTIVPFRGEYYTLVPHRNHLVRNLIYPVPDPDFPFLGVHFTRMISGDVEAGPNAVLALKREGYGRFDFSISDTVEMLLFRGFWRMAAKYWKMGVGEFYRSLNKNAFVRALGKLVPEIQIGDIAPAGSGVRAQALEPGGALVDDFRIVGSERTIHVLNAPSPAATASIPIGEAVAQMAVENFDLH